ncbi:MAG: DUF4271 domain-containing protein [Agriterribacter sp.]
MNKIMLSRFIGIFIAMQIFLSINIYAQDDSLATKTPSEIPSIIKDSATPKAVIKKPKVAVAIKADTIRTDTIRTDTIRIDTIGAAIIKAKVDSVQIPNKKDTIVTAPPYGTAVVDFISKHPYFNTESNIIAMPSQRTSMAAKDELFYIMCGVLFFLGILKVGFPKYFQDLFNVFWRSAFRQKQIRDQLQQAGMTTLLFNIFFVFSIALFAYLVILYFKGAVASPWILFSICFFSIAFVYTFKFFILKLSGWMFGQEEAIDTYTFIVFMVNKILSILIIPFTLILAFSDRTFQQIAFMLSIVLIIFLLIYRFIVSYVGMRNELKINGLHLALYICGFEIVPVLLIYRLLVDLFARSS